MMATYYGGSMDLVVKIESAMKASLDQRVSRSTTWRSIWIGGRTQETEIED